jgi:hypothetical protein
MRQASRFVQMLQHVAQLSVIRLPAAIVEYSFEMPVMPRRRDTPPVRIDQAD